MQTKLFKSLLFIILLTFTLLNLASCKKESYLFCNITFDGYLDTTNEVIIEYDKNITTNKEIYNDVHDDIEAILKRIEDEFSPQSENLKKVNINIPTFVSDEFIKVLKYSLDFSKDNPSFDVSIGALSNLWNISKQAEYCYVNDNCIKPSDEKIQETIKLVDYTKIKIDGNLVSVPDNMKLDFGAIVKGYAVDEVYNYLKDKGYSFFVINFGGSVKSYGESLTYKNKHKEFSIGIENPFNETTSLIDIKTKDESVITSSISKRYITVDGIKYHHILDKTTGYPVDNDIEQVTIVSSDGMLGDILSTTCILAGSDKAKELMIKYGVKGIIITKDKKIIVVGNLNVINNNNLTIDYVEVND